MRTARRLLVIVLALGLIACGDDKPPPPDGDSGKPGGGASKPSGGAKQGRLGIAAGKVVYKQTGFPEGSMTVWFQDHGATVVYDEDTTRVRMKQHKRTIWRDGLTTMHDYPTGKTTTHKLRVRATELAWNPTVKEEDLKRVGYEKLGTETIAGLECTIWKNTNLKVTYWVHAKLVLKEVNNLGKGFVMEATSFERLDAIPAEAFEVPEG